MSSDKENIQIVIMFIAPPETEEEGDTVFASHVSWIEKTHSREGNLKLIRYSISKGPELENPLDPQSRPTGNIVYVLDELYYC